MQQKNVKFYLSLFQKAEDMALSLSEMVASDAYLTACTGFNKL